MDFGDTFIEKVEILQAPGQILHDRNGEAFDPASHYAVDYLWRVGLEDQSRLSISPVAVYAMFNYAFSQMRNDQMWVSFRSGRPFVLSNLRQHGIDGTTLGHV